MRLMIVVACLVGAYLISDVTAQVPLGGIAGGIIPPVAPAVIPPLFPPFGLGLGFPFFPFPFLPGLGLGLGFGGRFGLGGLGLRRGLLGKRSVEENATLPVIPEVAVPQVPVNQVPVEEKISCVLNSQQSQTVLNCTSAHQTVQCDLLTRLTGVDTVKLRLADLTLRPVEVQNVEVLRLVSRKSLGKFTFIHPVSHQNVLLSLFSSQNVTEPGFLVREPSCFTQLVSWVSQVPERVRLSLVVNL